MLGVDLGSRRIGLAVSDRSGTLASPERVLARARGLVHDLGHLVQDMETVAAGHAAHLHIGVIPFVSGQMLSAAIGRTLPQGRQITVVLNGQKTAELHNGLFAEGHLTLQHGAGVIKFRKIAIKPL